MWPQYLLGLQEEDAEDEEQDLTAQEDLFSDKDEL